MLPGVSKFLCCIPLRIGAIIIGWFQILTGTAIILFLSITLSFPKLLPSIRHQFDYLTLAVFVYQFLIGYLLLKGIHRENLKYIKAWIILQIFHILLVFSVFLFKCFNFEYDILDNILLGESIISILIPDLINHILVIDVYFLIVVISIYTDMTDSAYRPVRARNSV